METNQYINTKIISTETMTCRGHWFTVTRKTITINGVEQSPSFEFHDATEEMFRDFTFTYDDVKLLQQMLNELLMGEKTHD